MCVRTHKRSVDLFIKLSCDLHNPHTPKIKNAASRNGDADIADSHHVDNPPGTSKKPSKARTERHYTVKGKMEKNQIDSCEKTASEFIF